MTQNKAQTKNDIFGQIRTRVQANVSFEEIEKELKDIRPADLTNPEEIKAFEEDLQNLSEPLPGVAWIESKTGRTDLIIERIWGRYHTIVILLPPNGLFVTGQGKLINCIYEYYKIDNNLKDSSYQKGGNLPDSGFFESTARINKEMLFEGLKNHIQPISQHIFLFPFILSAYDDASSIDIQKRPQMLFDGLESEFWENETFKVFECRINEPKVTNPAAECCLNYDEYSYFYEYVRKALFNFSAYENKPEKKFADDSKAVSTFFRYRLKAPSTFQIDIAKFNKDGKREGHLYPYRLSIRGITLRLFKTGVAILGFELHNYCYSRFEDIQRINDYGRRVYPQFIEQPSMDIPKKSFLADAVTLDISGQKVSERFEITDFWLKGNEQSLNLGKHITVLLGVKLLQKLYIQPVIDDRMFTICWYANQTMIHDLTSTPHLKSVGDYQMGGVRPTLSEGGYRFETSDEWHRFVFIDGQSCSCQDEVMKRDLLTAVTYRRWVKWGTLYGISRYSLMCLTTPDAPPFMREHMRRHYRQMAELLLAQRASMIVFSNRISDISGLIDDLNDKSRPQKFKEISKKVRTLHGDYIGFVNRLWFDEVTPQEQGIEMYDMAVKNMRLKEQMQELKAEIKELYEFIEMQESNTMNRTMLNLTQVASIGIPIAIVLAFWGISDDFVKTIDLSKNFAFRNTQGWLWVIISLVLALVLGMGINYWATKEDK